MSAQSCIMSPMANDEELQEIEGVIISERLDEPVKPVESKKPLDDYRKEIARYSYLANLFLRYGPMLFAVAIMASLAFWILASQDGYQGIFLVLLIIAGSMALVGLIAFGLGMLCRRVAISYMKRDPNYSRK